MDRVKATWGRWKQLLDGVKLEVAKRLSEHEIEIAWFAQEGVHDRLSENSAVGIAASRFMQRTANIIRA